LPAGRRIQKNLEEKKAVGFKGEPKLGSRNGDYQRGLGFGHAACQEKKPNVSGRGGGLWQRGGGGGFMPLSGGAEPGRRVGGVNDNNESMI